MEVSSLGGIIHCHPPAFSKAAGSEHVTEQHSVSGPGYLQASVKAAVAMLVLLRRAERYQRKQE